MALFIVFVGNYIQCPRGRKPKPKERRPTLASLRFSLRSIELDFTEEEEGVDLEAAGGL